MKQGRRFGLILGSVVVAVLLITIGGLVLAAAVTIDTFDEAAQSLFVGPSFGTTTSGSLDLKIAI